MSPRGNKKTTIAKLTREAKLRERRAEKKARKVARREAAAAGPDRDLAGADHDLAGADRDPAGPDHDLAPTEDGDSLSSSDESSAGPPSGPVLAPPKET